MNNPDPVHGLTAENFLAAFPVALQGDQSSAALADVTARLLARRPEEIDRLRIYSVIDQLDEQLLDILAYDFKVDWWDPEYTLEEKRQTLKDSWRVHKMMGTKAAVERAISAIYPNTQVLEWFEYGGEPYHFKLHIDISKESGDKDKPLRVLERVNFYKNLRSHLDVVEYVSIAPEAVSSFRVTPILGACMSITRLPELEAEPLPPARIGVSSVLCLTIAETILPELEEVV